MLLALVELVAEQFEHLLRVLAGGDEQLEALAHNVVFVGAAERAFHRVRKFEEFQRVQQRPARASSVHVVHALRLRRWFH